MSQSRKGNLVWAQKGAQQLRERKRRRQGGRVGLQLVLQRQSDKVHESNLPTFGDY